MAFDAVATRCLFLLVVSYMLLTKSYLIENNGVWMLLIVRCQETKFVFNILICLKYIYCIWSALIFAKYELISVSVYFYQMQVHMVLSHINTRWSRIQIIELSIYLGGNNFLGYVKMSLTYTFPLTLIFYFGQAVITLLRLNWSDRNSI